MESSPQILGPGPIFDSGQKETPGEVFELFLTTQSNLKGRTQPDQAPAEGTSRRPLIAGSWLAVSPAAEKPPQRRFWQHLTGPFSAGSTETPFHPEDLAKDGWEPARSLRVVLHGPNPKSDPQGHQHHGTYQRLGPLLKETRPIQDPAVRFHGNVDGSLSPETQVE